MRSSGSLSLIISCIAALPGVSTSLRADASDDVHLLKPVPIQEVKIEDAFWSPRLELWRKTTINDVFDKFEKYGGLRNFDRVANGQTGGHSGEPWWDGLVYESITGASRFLASHPDPEIKARIDGFVDRIAAAAAKDPDGFVNTGCTLDGIGIKWSNPPTPGDTFDDRNPHLLYNAGCLVEAGVNLYRATGDTKLLKIAVRMANYMCGIMGAPPKLNIIPGHALGEKSFIELYELFKEQPALKVEMGMPVDENEYRRLAEFWIEHRGNTTGGRHSDGTYNQDDKSVFEQTTMEGHSVRSVLLAAGVVKAASINGRADYADTGKRWFDNMVDAKMYITGGLGAIPSIEGFGPDYELPNTGYAETCAAVAGGFFGHEMNLLTGNAKYVDVLEKELYNGALSGVALTGTEYFYTNHLSAGPDHRRWDWKGGSLGLTPCCPPMFLKLLGDLPRFIYATSADAVYVNLYIGSTARVKTDTLDLELKQSTEYPWEGTTEFAVTPAEPGEFTLNLRVPSWAKNPSVEVNGAVVSPLTTERNYIQLKRGWKAGDTVVLRLPMPVEKVKADPRVAANVGRVALMRGPIVYCFEGVDNEGPARSFVLSANDSIKPEFKPDLMGGMMVLKGTASLMRRENGETRTTPTRFTAIPFYANANREPTNMEVWIPDDKTQAAPLTFAGLATPSASHCFENDTVFALNDGLEPSKSDDESIPRMTFWDHRGSTEWVRYEFPTQRKINSVDVYWWDERRLGRNCRVPSSWTLQYLDGTTWRPVKNTDPYGVQMDKFNRVGFQTVETKAIRIIATLQPGWSGGILEWRVSGPEDAKVSVVPRADTNLFLRTTPVH